MYNILSAIIQGCPVSGTILVLVVGSFLRMLKDKAKKSTSKAFADDFGTLLSEMLDMIDIEKCFWPFEKSSGLAQKTNKCVIIPRGRPLTD